MRKYYHILTEEETRNLFKNFEALFSRVILLEIHNKKLRRKIARQSVIKKGSTQRNLQKQLNDLSVKLEI